MGIMAHGRNRNNSHTNNSSPKYPPQRKFIEMTPLLTTFVAAAHTDFDSTHYAPLLATLAGSPTLPLPLVAVAPHTEFDCTRIVTRRFPPPSSFCGSVRRREGCVGVADPAQIICEHHIGERLALQHSIRLASRAGLRSPYFPRLAAILRLGSDRAVRFARPLRLPAPNRIVARLVVSMDKLVRIVGVRPQSVGLGSDRFSPLFPPAPPFGLPFPEF